MCIYIGIHLGFTYLIYICIFCPPQRFVHWAAAKFQAPQAQEGRRWNQRSAEYGHVIQRQGEVGPITTGGNDPIWRAYDSNWVETNHQLDNEIYMLGSWGYERCHYGCFFCLKKVIQKTRHFLLEVTWKFPLKFGEELPIMGLVLKNHMLARKHKEKLTFSSGSIVTAYCKSCFSGNWYISNPSFPWQVRSVVPHGDGWKLHGCFQK